MKYLWKSDQFIIGYFIPLSPVILSLSLSLAVWSTYEWISHVQNDGFNIHITDHATHDDYDYLCLIWISDSELIFVVLLDSSFMQLILLLLSFPLFLDPFVTLIHSDAFNFMKSGFHCENERHKREETMIGSLEGRENSSSSSSFRRFRCLR